MSGGNLSGVYHFYTMAVIARLIIEHHREWLASLADYMFRSNPNSARLHNRSSRCITVHPITQPALTNKSYWQGYSTGGDTLHWRAKNVEE